MPFKNPRRSFALWFMSHIVRPRVTIVAVMALPPGTSLHAAYVQATSVLDPRRADRSLSADLAAAEGLLTRLGRTHAAP